MTRRLLPAVLVTTLLFASSLAAQQRGQYDPPNPPYQPTADEKAQLQAKLDELGKRVAALRAAKRDETLVNDVDVYYKAGTWLLRYPEEFYNKTYLPNAMLVLDRGLARAADLEKGQAPWTTQKGRVTFAYRSKVDSSLQPYAAVVPDGYDKSKPSRLDVVLHGRGSTLSEVSFIHLAETVKNPVIYPDRIELHVFGRTNNAYRWSGETDVFEALAALKSRFNINSEKIVLRGFSMGGAGTWHIGLHYPHLWRAIEAGAGFTDTKLYAKLPEVPDYINLPLRIYDAVEYARNVYDVPTVGYGGDQDPQLQSTLNIKGKLSDEELHPGDVEALWLIGPNIGHKFHPDSKRLSDEFINTVVARPMPKYDDVSFVTYTTRYGKFAWFEIEGLERHYTQARLDAKDGKITTKNISRLNIKRPGSVTLDGQKITAPGHFVKTGGTWVKAGPDTGLRKRPGLQGPIDDAFMESFLCVKPAGKSDARLDTFTRNYAKWLRADARVTDDTKVTAAQIKDNNLILFGDTSTNKLIARIAPKLPMAWPTSPQTLVMIYPNPLNPSKYVVINTGHTFGDKDFRGTNALLYPRLGDWAVLDADGKVVKAGLFDEQWRP